MVKMDLTVVRGYEVSQVKMVKMVVTEKWVPQVHMDKLVQRDRKVLTALMVWMELTVSMELRENRDVLDQPELMAKMVRMVRTGPMDVREYQVLLGLTAKMGRMVPRELRV